MFNNYMMKILFMKYNLMLYLYLFISPFMVMSVNSLFSVWINMEMNLLMFLLLIILNNSNIYDSSMKYFLINSFSSSVFLLMINMNFFSVSNLYQLIMILMMFMKLGMFPFHYWFIDMMLSLNWINCLILSTWQKLIPFFILFNMINDFMFILMIILNGLLSLIMGMNQINVKKIMGYSSINHMCWMLLILMLEKNLFFYYFFYYMLINMMIMMMMNKFNYVNLIDMYKMFNLNFKYYLMSMFMSLGGLPPFFGFTLKWYSMFEIMMMNNYFLLLILLFYSLMYLYYYMRLIMSFLLMNFYTMKNFYILLNLKENYSMIFFLKFLMLLNLFIIMFWFMY